MPLSYAVVWLGVEVKSLGLRVAVEINIHQDMEAEMVALS